VSSDPSPAEPHGAVAELHFTWGAPGQRRPLLATPAPARGQGHASEKRHDAGFLPELTQPCINSDRCHKPSLEGFKNRVDVALGDMV